MANDSDNLANARAQAQAQFESIVEMVAALERARKIEAGEFDWEEEAARLGGACFDTDDEDGWRKAGEDGPLHDNAEEFCREAAPDDYPNEDEAHQRIEEDALSVQIRSGWYSPGETPKPAEFEIQLCTGGPAVRIIGDLGDHNEPERARLQYQDWFAAWTEWLGGPEHCLSDIEGTLLDYARIFYFGEG